jgi:hypothetical protein
VWSVALVVTAINERCSAATYSPTQYPGQYHRR